MDRGAKESRTIQVARTALTEAFGLHLCHQVDDHQLQTMLSGFASSVAKWDLALDRVEVHLGDWLFLGRTVPSLMASCLPLGGGHLPFDGWTQLGRALSSSRINSKGPSENSLITGLM